MGLSAPNFLRGSRDYLGRIEVLLNPNGVIPLSPHNISATTATKKTCRILTCHRRTARLYLPYQCLLHLQTLANAWTTNTSAGKAADKNANMYLDARHQYLSAQLISLPHKDYLASVRSADTSAGQHGRNIGPSRTIRLDTGHHRPLALANYCSALMMHFGIG